MIRAMKLSKRYPGGTTALEDVDLEVGRGEFVFITGASGAGKTTLLRLILRQELPSSGQVLVNGRNVGALPVVQGSRPPQDPSVSCLPGLQAHPAARPPWTTLRTCSTSMGLPRWGADGGVPFRRSAASGLHHRLSVLPLRRCPAASNSASPSPAPWSTSPRSFWPTSRPAISIPDLAVEIMRLFREDQRPRNDGRRGHPRPRARASRMQRRVVTLDRGRLVPPESPRRERRLLARLRYFATDAMDEWRHSPGVNLLASATLAAALVPGRVWSQLVVSTTSTASFEHVESRAQRCRSTCCRTPLSAELHAPDRTSGCTSLTEVAEVSST